MVKLIARAAVSGTFGERRPITKYEIASLLAKCFPVLHWELPPKRKIWDSEDYRMSIFDAAALAVSGLKPGEQFDVSFARAHELGKLYPGASFPRSTRITSGRCSARSF